MSVDGYIVVLRGDRVEDFEGSVSEYGRFGEPVPDFSHRRGTPLVCFVSTRPGRVTHVAEGTLGVRAGTSRTRLNLAEIEELRSPVRTRAILARVAAGVRRHVRLRLQRGGPLPPRSFEDFIGAVIDLAPEVAPTLRRYSEERRRQIARIPEGERGALAAQKEAITTALSIAGIDRSVLSRWAPGQERKSLLDGLSDIKLMEDQVIWHDAAVPFDGFQKVRRSIVGGAKFNSKDVELDVVIANRFPLERQTGADLLYYNATYHSFVFIQYKVMERVKRANSRMSEPIYRLPNRQLRKEIARMYSLLALIHRVGGPTNRHGFRLHENPFYLKLCPRLVFNPDDVRLTPGMYIPLAQWRFIETDNDLVGPKGGRVVSYENVGRHINNTGFADLVRDAWIGTTPQQSAVIGTLVETVLRGGKAIVLAVKKDTSMRRAEHVPE